MQAKTLPFEDKTLLIKKTSEDDSDFLTGRFNGAEICELLDLQQVKVPKITN